MPSLPTGATPTVMIVEDEPDLREAVAEAMEQAGYRMIAVGDLEQARSTLASTRVDLLLLDLFVDGLTCDDWLRELAGATDPPATVLTSADATQRSHALAQRFALELVLKPFDLDDLIAALERALVERRVPTAAS